MPLYILVAAGGALGAMARYFVALGVGRMWSHSLPMGTMVVNVSGCLIIGMLTGAAESRSFLTAEARAFLIVGVLGGYTTFSSFGLEAFELIRRGQMLVAMMHIAGQCALGTLAVAAGYALLRGR